MTDRSEFMMERPSADIWTAAAVREHFQADELLDRWLSANEEASSDQRIQAMEAAEALRQHGVRGEDANGLPNLRLPLHRRLDILRLAGKRKALEALHDVSEKTLAERTFEAMLADETPIPDRDNRTRLAALETVSAWATAAGAQLPFDPSDVVRSMARSDFLATMAGSDLHRFVGRDRLMATLAAWWTDTPQNAALLIEGPGGIGKSFAVSRFLADLLDRPDYQRVDAIFHIDFDRPSLLQARTSTILAECIRQAATNWAVERNEELMALVREETSGYSELDMHQGTSRSRESSKRRGRVADRLIRLMSRRGLSPRFVMFVDSFEQIEGIDQAVAEAPGKVALQLEQAGAEVRTIYVSRSFVQPDALSSRAPLRLPQFSMAEAKTYLTNEADRYGVYASPSGIAKVIAAVGRSPLSLRMAVSLIEGGESPAALANWAGIASGSTPLIQAVLYDRILHRLRDPDLRAVAFPGLVLRRLTAEILEEVLAEPCGLALGRLEADRLMLRARQQGQLFTSDPADPGALRHRQDVRALMLPAMDREIPAATAFAINQAAVNYYARRGGLINRTEELYHRLRLDGPFELIDERWSREAAARLRSALMEFSPRSRKYLRMRLAADVYYSGLPAAYERPSRRNAEMDELRQEVLRELQEGALSERVRQRLIDQGAQGLDGPVGDIVAQTLLVDRRFDEIVDGARRMLVGNPAHPEAQAGVLSTSAALLEGQGHLSEAQTFWQRAWRVAMTLDRRSALAALIGLIRIRRKTGDDDLRRSELQTAAELVERMSYEELRGERVLAREAAAELGEQLIDGSERERGYDSILSLVEFVIKANEAFPSAEGNPARIMQLYEQLDARFDELPSLDRLNSIVGQRLYAGSSVTAAVVAALRAEVDWTLERAVSDTATQEVQSTNTML